MIQNKHNLLTTKLEEVSLTLAGKIAQLWSRRPFFESLYPQRLNWLTFLLKELSASNARTQIEAASFWNEQRARKDDRRRLQCETNSTTSTLQIAIYLWTFFRYCLNHFYIHFLVSFSSYQFNLCSWNSQKSIKFIIKVSFWKTSLFLQILRVFKLPIFIFRRIQIKILAWEFEREKWKILRNKPLQVLLCGKSSSSFSCYSGDKI